ncbi:uncharacterized protein LOC132920513 [Rhopalosiphum padi]|uniref:uncharacterized protein LOC132920513 n=1 Tax=Rhopalosiphum padi TaxID=40932 RepID=UPI00298DA1D0|nr:uncharacterized protein LOC132920513 [Rhopalosiphum padi]XP_060838946.1 uncharacterized protein LOC132920513 [Rhopalosiphum padi]XP_060838947.1 uncharacterized protein LOC132920513 [Rhopalosiphum padi]XP_060838948.1 uncharacterized protein LOC132920513 [Rhopalosiphum padi]
MAPKTVLVRNRNKSNNNIFIKKLNHFMIINKNLRKRIEDLSEKNKQLSATRNSLLLQKLELQNQNNTIRNSNIQLTAMQNIMRRKLSVLEQTIQSCIPSLVTMSQCIPSMLEIVHEMSKCEVNNFNKEKKEKQTETVRPMIHGITQSTVTIKQFDMSPIIESPNSSSEQTPVRPRRSSYRSSPHSKLNVEPYVRLKDVAAMLKNSKAVPNDSPKHRLNENVVEDSSWLNTQENQIQYSNDNTSVTQYGNSSPGLNTLNEIQADVPMTASTTIGSIDNTFNETEVRQSDLLSPIDSSMLRNITCRKRAKRSSESSNTSGINDSISSGRPSRSATKKVNYKEKSLCCKLRR